MIRMIAGVYGLTVKKDDGSTFVKGMGPSSGSFALSIEKEAELVKLGVAEYTEAAFGFNTLPAAYLKPLEEMSVKELREFGKTQGVTLRVGLTKIAMAEIIREQMAKNEDEEKSVDETESFVEDGKESDIEAEDGEEAPSFDATQAVQ